MTLPVYPDTPDWIPLQADIATGAALYSGALTNNQATPYINTQQWQSANIMVTVGSGNPGASRAVLQIREFLAGGGVLDRTVSFYNDNPLAGNDVGMVYNMQLSGIGMFARYYDQTGISIVQIFISGSSRPGKDEIRPSSANVVGPLPIGEFSQTMPANSVIRFPLVGPYSHPVSFSFMSSQAVNAYVTAITYGTAGITSAIVAESVPVANLRSYLTVDAPGLLLLPFIITGATPTATGTVSAWVNT